VGRKKIVLPLIIKNILYPAVVDEIEGRLVKRDK
jgi:hypothetical protein